MDLNFIDQAVPSIFINLLNAETQLTEAKVKAIATTTFHLGLALHDARNEFLKEHTETLKNTTETANVVDLETAKPLHNNVTNLKISNEENLPALKNVCKLDCCQAVQPTQPLQVAAQAQDSTLATPMVRRRGRPVGSTKKVKS